jgi:3-deoxy-D-manno-octulosonate 8-phosphate phosphatase (KDO 8-P phosphatase)
MEFTIENDLKNATTIKNVLGYFNRITTFIFDVDGVLTDGKLLVTENGEFLRTFHSRDGYALRRAIEEGFNVCIITGGKGGSIENRLTKLGVKHFYTSADDKVTPLQNFLKTYDIDPADVLFMGDDLNDLKVMQKIGLPCCPANACPEIMAISHYISPINGGEGCVRDVIEKVMKLKEEGKKGHWLNNISISG